VRLECASFRNEVGKGFNEIVIAHAGGNAAWTAQLLVDKGARGGDGVRRRSTGRSIAVVHLEEKDEGGCGPRVGHFNQVGCGQLGRLQVVMKLKEMGHDDWLGQNEGRRIMGYRNWF
jgi:hypothetical protein